MAKRPTRNRRHFILDGITETEPYRYPGGGGGGTVVPARNRVQHGGELRRQVDSIRQEANSARIAQRDAGMETDLGLRVEFESFPDIVLAFESLARERSGIELLNVRYENNCTLATVFVPDGKLDHFERLIRDYIAKKRDSAGRPCDNRRLIDAIQQIRAASLQALWTDVSELFPTADEGPVWWEVWLPVRGDRSGSKASFHYLAQAQGIKVAEDELSFPERTVLLACASSEQLQNSMFVLNSIAELRRPKETAEFFGSLQPHEQSDWLQELLQRVAFPHEDNQMPYVCLLDTGVNRGHRLLSPALQAKDMHTVEPAWGVGDTDGHGTALAGVALLGNLTGLLASDDSVEIRHRLESVKLLPRDRATGEDPYHHGYLTSEAVARPEITAPSRLRVFGMAVTARDNRDRGRPSAWSSAIDTLAADVDGHGQNPRLLVVSAGNIEDTNAWSNYPDSNDSDGIHDPAQAWNALTVGAYTDLVRITEEETVDSVPVASRGGLSPFSTTSVTWQPHWPLKPDVVLEGGNVAKDPFGAVWMASLSLLTTHYLPLEQTFTTTNATSAAVAFGTRFAAQVMATYPQLWPETVRALIIHSAEWTDAMKRQYLPEDRNPSKSEYLKLVRRCGFGVPDIDRAVWTVENSLTMLVEERLKPYGKQGGRDPTLQDMHLHSLPWPIEILENLGETQVEMRVTLSYFIEPNPSRRGVRSRYRYESHGLRYDVKRPFESVDLFRERINKAARHEGKRSPGNRGEDSGWLIGTHGRHRGSLHCDIWKGTAADLASRGFIAVYPTSGWWKTRPALERYDKAARYALVVSIKAPEVNVDLYTEVENKIVPKVQIET